MFIILSELIIVFLKVYYRSFKTLSCFWIILWSGMEDLTLTHCCSSDVVYTVKCIRFTLRNAIVCVIRKISLLICFPKHSNRPPWMITLPCLPPSKFKIQMQLLNVYLKLERVYFTFFGGKLGGLVFAFEKKSKYLKNEVVKCHIQWCFRQSPLYNQRKNMFNEMLLFVFLSL